MKANKQLIAVLLGVSLLPSATQFGNAFVHHANAGSTSTTMAVSASVPSNCNFTGGAISLGFGSYDPVGANASSDLNSTTSLGIRCTKGTSALLSMNNGTNANGEQRRMSDGSNFLNYQVYTSASYSTIWNAINTVSYLAQNSNSATITIHGKVPGGQTDIPAGTYTDTVTITATY